jgi:HD-GYP domain-containing protein (c-di-GMP phosphodiesterase class II)
VVSIDKKSRLIDSPVTPECLLAGMDRAWEAVERFSRQAAGLTDLGDLIDQALRAVRESIQADVVYWSSPVVAEVRQVGDRTLSKSWCRQFVDRLLEDTPGAERQLLRADLSAARPLVSGLGHGPPTSAALVRISRSQSTWISALRFQPHPPFRPGDLKIMAVIRQILVQEQRRRRMMGKMTDTLFWLVHCLTATLDSQGTFWEGHSERVARMAVRVGREMELPTPVLSDLYFAGLLHDLGRKQLDEKLLLKPGPLTAEEWSHVRRTPVLADSIMAPVQPLQHLRPAVRHHRERYDGQGYPDHLAGHDIPLLARVLGVADACDAMMSRRPHRPGLSPEEIDSVLRSGAGAQWDPQIVDRFMACRSDVYRIGHQKTEAPVVNVVGHVVEGWNFESSPKLGDGVLAVFEKGTVGAASPNRNSF